MGLADIIKNKPSFVGVAPTLKPEDIKKSPKKVLKSIYTDGDTLKNQTMISKVRTNREYLLSSEISTELNTYATWGPFATFNDAFDHKYDTEKKGAPLKDGDVGAPGVRSIFNKMGAVLVGNTSNDIITGEASEWRISNNVPLMDNVASRKAIRANSGCTIRELVQASAEGKLGRNTYDYSDFMYCKHLGKVSNNYLITLRRFPLPVDDYISAIGTSKDIRSASTSKNVQSIGCMVTWLGTPGNEMSSILKYTVSMPFKEVGAQLQDSNIDADANSKRLNSIAGMFDAKYRQQYMDGMAGGNNEIMNKMFGMSDQPYRVSDFTRRDDAKAYGPVDVVKTTHMRAEDGLKFEQTFSLTFDYELRSYNGVNGRQAMLDLISNILNVVYSTGTFWGGGYRGTGAHQNNIFANLEVFKKNGGFTDFADSFAKDISTIGGAAKNAVDSHGGFLGTLKYALNQLGGMLVGGMLNKFGRPQKTMMNSILSPAPVGFWHVTIGNPHHPIMSIGNMIIDSAQIEHYGPLGLDDFPTGLKVTVNLKRAKSRDLRDIEKLYMHGNDRIYTSMGPKVFDMYTYAKEYKGSRQKTNLANADTEIKANETLTDIGQMKGMQEILAKYFGHSDTYSIYVSACEQEDGAHKKKKTGTAGGDSSAGGNIVTS